MEHELGRRTKAFFDKTGFVGMCSMEYKQDQRTGKFFMIEPTVGRTDWQEEVASLNGVNIPLAAYRYELGLPPSPTPKSVVPWSGSIRRPYWRSTLVSFRACVRREYERRAPAGASTTPFRSPSFVANGSASYGVRPGGPSHFRPRQHSVASAQRHGSAEKQGAVPDKAALRADTIHLVHLSTLCDREKEQRAKNEERRTKNEERCSEPLLRYLSKAPQAVRPVERWPRLQAKRLRVGVALFGGLNHGQGELARAIWWRTRHNFQPARQHNSQRRTQGIFSHEF